MIESGDLDLNLLHAKYINTELGLRKICQMLEGEGIEDEPITARQSQREADRILYAIQVKDMGYHYGACK